MEDNFILLKSVHLYINQQGDIYKITENGNVDDSNLIGNIVNMQGLWWKNLSKADYATAETIWRTKWDK